MITFTIYAFVLFKFVSKAADLIIVIKCYAHIAFLCFAADSSSILIFIVIEVLSDFALFVK